MKYLKIFSILIFSIFFLVGCWDFEDTNDKNIIISVGLDKLDDDIGFTCESTISESNNNDQKQNESSNANINIIMGKGKNYEAARNDLDNSTSYKLFLGFTRIVIFSNDFAQNGIQSYINRIDTLFDYRKSLIPIVSKDKIKEIFKTKIENDIGVGFYLENNIIKETNKGEYYYITIHEIINKENLGIGYLLPYVTIDNNRLVIYGYAAMSDESKLVDTITKSNPDLLKGIVYLLNNEAKITTNIQYNTKNKYSFTIALKKRNIKTKYLNGIITADIDLSCDAILQYEYKTEQLDDKTKHEIEKIISKEVEKEISKVIEHSQKINCDFIGLAQYFNRDYHTIYKTMNWKTQFKSVITNVNVNTTFKNGTFSSIDKNK